MSMENMLAVVSRIKDMESTIPQHQDSYAWATDALAALVVLAASDEYAFVPKGIQQGMEAIIATAPNKVRSEALAAILKTFKDPNVSN